MVRPAGLEPATLGLEGPMSDRLYQDGYCGAAACRLRWGQFQEMEVIVLAAGEQPDNRSPLAPKQRMPTGRR